ncbi:flagellar basal body-associated protein FliL [Modicisalibacter luteus]|jgi:flagellar FliL protein|uniref:Flagellar protein FliL n=1 Tax=Modicisalibacter luteus TaxID=453962 RepID=A0ABV7M2N0_9GAMM|nr:flagellar basal body-associated protein FliL [Halomonas lutea]GHA84303.1 flagellar basal body protein FliL [Halomonas lutea]
MAKNPNAGTSRKPWWLLGIILIVLSMASSAGVYFLLDSKSEASTEGVEETAEPIKPEPPIFVTVSPFTVNLQSDQYEQRLLYIGLSFKVADETTREMLEQNMPQLRSRLLMLFSSQHAESLTTPEGKRALSQQILALFDEPFSDPQPKLAVNDVLYTDFIVQ